MSLHDVIFARTHEARYVAVYAAGELTTRVRPDIASPSAPESDRYEELFVNPALLTLTRQRGELDCGGLRYVLVRYGNFFQCIVPTTHGHVSVCLEKEADAQALAEVIAGCVTGAGA